jgi:hypothetical protein
VRKSITVTIAIVMAILLARIFWPAPIIVTGEELPVGPYDVPGLGIHKLEPIW